MGTYTERTEMGHKAVISSVLAGYLLLSALKFMAILDECLGSSIVREAFRKTEEDNRA